MGEVRAEVDKLNNKVKLEVFNLRAKLDRLNVPIDDKVTIGHIINRAEEISGDMCTMACEAADNYEKLQEKGDDAIDAEDCSTHIRLMAKIHRASERVSGYLTTAECLIRTFDNDGY